MIKHAAKFPLLTRRGFLQGTLVGSAFLATRGFAMFPGGGGGRAGMNENIVLDLPPLPYAEDALEPVISAKTISFHYGKHHRAYVDNCRKLIAGTGFESMPLEEIIRKSADKEGQQTIFNNAAQVWNHTFFWYSMKPGGGGKPTGRLAEEIDRDFGGFDAFRQEFVAAATTLFGSGWVWLVRDPDKLRIMKTANAVTPMEYDHTPLLTLDVWEHAYYLDFQNRRPDYVNAWLDNLVDWDFANNNLKTV